MGPWLAEVVESQQHGGQPSAEPRPTASRCDRRVGRDVRDCAKSIAWRPARWWTYSVFDFAPRTLVRVPPGDFDSSAHGLLLLGGVDSVGNSFTDQQSPPTTRV